MNYTPALHFTQNIETDLSKMNDDDISHLNVTIHTLGTYEEIFRDNNFEYERDVFHESRCLLDRIRTYGRVEKNDAYEVARKRQLAPDDYIKKLAHDYMQIDNDEESSTCIEDVINDFSQMDAKSLSYIEFLINEKLSSDD